MALDDSLLRTVKSGAAACKKGPSAKANGKDGQREERCARLNEAHLPFWCSVIPEALACARHRRNKWRSISKDRERQRRKEDLIRWKVHSGCRGCLAECPATLPPPVECYSTALYLSQLQHSGFTRWVSPGNDDESWIGGPSYSPKSTASTINLTTARRDVLD